MFEETGVEKFVECEESEKIDEIDDPPESARIFLEIFLPHSIRLIHQKLLLASIHRFVFLGCLRFLVLPIRLTL
jgi:hypothetical protein